MILGNLLMIPILKIFLLLVIQLYLMMVLGDAYPIRILIKTLVTLAI